MANFAESSELEKFRQNGDVADHDSQTKNQSTCTAPRTSSFLSKMTLEPAMAGALMALFLVQTSQINFYMRTACLVDLQLPRATCEAGVGEAFRKAEIATQEYVSSIKALRGFVIAVIATMVLLFMGPWSDCSRRRKPLIVMSLLGMCISSLNAIILLTFPYFSAGWVMYIVQIPIALGGGFNLLTAAAFCYISDICAENGRDSMIVFSSNRACMQVAKVLGSVAGPLIFRQLGFYGVYSTALFLQASALAFVLWRVRDVQVNTANKVSPLDVRLPVAAVRCLVAPRPHHRRKIVLMMILVAVMDRVMLEADDLLSFLYFRNKFVWDDLMFGYFTAFQNAVLFCGTIFTIKCMKSKLRMSDEMIGVLSGASLAVSKLTLIASTSTYFVFLVPFAGFVSTGSLSVQRTIVNRHIEPSEQGKIHSVAGGLEQAFQAAIIPLFPVLYSRTAEHAPDAWLGVFVGKASLQAALFLATILLTARQLAAESEETSRELKLTTEATRNCSNGNDVVGTEFSKKDIVLGISDKHAEKDLTLVADTNNEDQSLLRARGEEKD